MEILVSLVGRCAGQSGLRHLRLSTGSAFLELGLALFFMVVMLLFTLDVCMVLVAFGVNDKACRDAARAAAQGRTKEEALKLAKAALRQHATSSALIEKPAIIENEFAYVPNPAPDDKPSKPFVSVTTITSTKVPAPILLVGQTVVGNRVGVVRRYIYPIVKLSQR